MEQAKRLVEEIRQGIKPLDDTILSHPYIEAAEKGLIPREKLSHFAGEQHRIIESDIRSVALLVSRCTTEKTQRFFLDVLAGEDAAFKALHVLANAMNLTEEWLESYTSSAESQAYTHFLAWLASHGSPAELAGAFLVNLPAWGANCGRMAQALRRSYGFTDEQVEFLVLFATPRPEAEQPSIEVIQEGMDEGVPPMRIRDAARFLQANELLFWDGLQKTMG
jgi:pyrroloquinoline quinone (PQQ) biosynthesis protein C